MKWQESIQKNIERSFGILKSTGRFCKNPIELLSMNDISNWNNMSYFTQYTCFRYVMADINARYDPFFSVCKDENAKVVRTSRICCEICSTEMNRIVQCQRIQWSKKCFNKFFLK